jgi:iron complex transport system substrate-binding protein
MKTSKEPTKRAAAPATPSALRHALAAALAALMMAMSLVLGACAAPGPSDDKPADAQADAPATTDAPAVIDTMADRSFTDMAGREVTVPGLGALERVYFTGFPAEIYCLTLAPELAGGTSSDGYTEAELELLPAGTRDLKYLGTLSGGKELNPESILEADIQLIISVAFDDPAESDKTQADDLQAQTGIPVVVFSGNLDRVEEVYAELGKLLGREDEAATLGAYCAEKLAAVKAAVATVPEDARVSLYYAEGPEGLQTEPESSQHALAFKIAGAKNVADVEAAGGKGMSNTSLEQVIAWDPQVIIAWDDVVRGGADELIRTDSNWAPIKAVRDGRVYTMPNVPYSWCDRPPSVNRFLGIQWVAHMLYPDAYNVDMVQETRDFYRLFYHVDIDEAKAKEILGNSAK